MKVNKSWISSNYSSFTGSNKDRKCSDDQATCNRRVSFKDLIILNKSQLPLLLTGIIAALLIGIVYPAMAALFSEVLRVSKSNIYVN